MTPFQDSRQTRDGNAIPFFLDRREKPGYYKSRTRQYTVIFSGKDGVSMELTRAVGETIKRIRKTKKLSMERLAAESGVSRSMLGQIERGEANPSVALLGKLASALKVPAEVLLENDDFQTLQLVRELDTRPKRLDGGKAVLRPSFPYDDTTRQETYFLDLYISARYTPEPSVPGCVCHATVLSGTVSLTAEGEVFQLLERDALRFAADRPYEFTNMTNSTARLLLSYRYLK